MFAVHYDTVVTVFLYILAISGAIAICGGLAHPLLDKPRARRVMEAPFRLLPVKAQESAKVGAALFVVISALVFILSLFGSGILKVVSESSSINAVEKSLNVQIDVEGDLDLNYADQRALVTVTTASEQKFDCVVQTDSTGTTFDITCSTDGFDLPISEAAKQ